MIKYDLLSIGRIFFVLFPLCLGCNKDPEPTGPVDPGLIFQSGFEGTSAIEPTSTPQIVDITGIDNTLPQPNDWRVHFDHHRNIGKFQIYYEAGTADQRIAEIIPDPTQPGNHILNFKLSDINVRGDEEKGRIQADVYENRGLKQIYQSVRVYFHPDLSVLQDYPGRIHWFTLFELWNNAGWDGDSNRYRVSINLEKPRDDHQLYFKVFGQTYQDGPEPWNTIWEVINYSVPVPFGEWVTLDLYVLEGDRTHGRFYLAMTDAAGTKQLIFDEYHYTHEPNDPDPDGLAHFNPFKLYTGADLINYVKDQGKSLQIYWDDYRLWKDRTPETVLPE